MRRQGGFTIIEVTLFLAISAALLLLIAGLQSLVSRQRFQDTMTSLRTTIQSEYEEVRSGINSRIGSGSMDFCGDKAAGTSDCLTLGKTIRFDASTDNGQNIYINYVVMVDDLPASGLSDEESLRSLSSNNQLKVIDSVASTRTSDAATKQQTTKIKQGGEFTQGKSIPDGSAAPENVIGLAILRSPVSSAVMVFVLKPDAIDGSGNLKLDKTTYNTPSAFFIKNAYSGFDGGAICVDRGSSSSAVQVSVPADPKTSTTWSADSLRKLCGYAQ